MPSKKNPRPLPPLRVRREPPTVEEAVVAAQALTDDVDQQIEVAAGLIGLSEDEIRPHVLSAPRLAHEPARLSDQDGRALRRSAPTVVVVQRRARPGLAGSRPLDGAYKPVRRG